MNRLHALAGPSSFLTSAGWGRGHTEAVITGAEAARATWVHFLVRSLVGLAVAEEVVEVGAEAEAGAAAFAALLATAAANEVGAEVGVGAGAETEAMVVVVAGPAGVPEEEGASPDREGYESR